MRNPLQTHVFQFNEQRYGPEVKLCGINMRIKKMVLLIGRNRKVLDLGCTDGLVGNILMDLSNEVDGIDASEQAVRKACLRGVRARVGNLEEEFPYPDGCFDDIFAGEIIEHIYNIDLFLEEIYRVLKLNGSLVLSTPNLATFGRRLLLLFNKNPHIEISFTGEAAGHIRYFVKDTLFQILGKHHFRVKLYTSDIVNFNASGTIHSYWLANLFPTLGQSLIVKATKI